MKNRVLPQWMVACKTSDQPNTVSPQITAVSSKTGTLEQQTSSLDTGHNRLNVISVEEYPSEKFPQQNLSHVNLHDLSDEENSPKKVHSPVKHSTKREHSENGTDNFIPSVRVTKDVCNASRSEVSCDNAQIDELLEGCKTAQCSQEITKKKIDTGGNLNGKTCKNDASEFNQNTMRNETVLSAEANSNDGPAACTVTSPVQRQSCIYGSSCYRQNPLHKQDFAHPGDTDFIEPSTNQQVSNAPDTRPLCKYGIECYRKNPQHRRDFRHDVSRRPRKARPENFTDNNSEDDDGDFNASISSDDYDPSASDDSFVTSDSMGSGESDFDPEKEEEDEYEDKKKRKRKEKKKQNANKKAK